MVCFFESGDAPECFHQVEYYECRETPVEFFELSLFNQYLEELLFLEATKKTYKEGCTQGSFLEREERLLAMIEILEGLKGSDFGRFSSKVRESYISQVYDIQVSNRNYRCSYNVKKKTVSRLRALIKEVF